MLQRCLPFARPWIWCGQAHARVQAACCLRLLLTKHSVSPLALLVLFVNYQAVTAVQSLHLVSPTDPDIRELTECHQSLQNLDNVKLGQTSMILQRVRSHLHGLQPFHLQLLVQLGRAHQVIVFIQSEGSEFQV
jgi:hypothetical protein